MRQGILRVIQLYAPTINAKRGDIYAMSTQLLAQLDEKLGAVLRCSNGNAVMKRKRWVINLKEKSIMWIQNKDDFELDVGASYVRESIDTKMQDAIVYGLKTGVFYYRGDQSGLVKDIPYTEIDEKTCSEMSALVYTDEKDKNIQFVTTLKAFEVPIQAILKFNAGESEYRYIVVFFGDDQRIEYREEDY